MVYTILAEARTGGSHLVESIQKHTGFDLAAEPWTGSPNWFTKTRDVSEIGWISNYENIIIKEIYEPMQNYENLINISDKVLCLYKENWYSQAKSILYARRFEDWQWEYKKSDVDNTITDEQIYEFYYNGNFRFHKWDFQQFIKQNNFPSISYEELYYRNGVEKIKEVFNLSEDFKFPIYERHLKNDDGTTVGYEQTPDEPKDLKYLKDILGHHFPEREQMRIMYNTLIEQQEINKKILEELRSLKEGK